MTTASAHEVTKPWQANMSASLTIPAVPLIQRKVTTVFKLSARSAGRRLAPVAFACALLGVAPTASAAPAAYDCPDNVYACLYDGPNGTGARHEITQCGQRVDLPREWWDRVDSARIVHAGNITLWSYYPNGGGGSELVLRGTRGQNVNAYAANMADIVECR